MGETETVVRPLVQHIWAFAAVMKRASAVRALRFKVYQNGKPGSEEVTDPNDPVVKLLRHPTPIVYTTQGAFWSALLKQHDIAGGSYIFLLGNDGKQVRSKSGNGIDHRDPLLDVPAQLWPIREETVHFDLNKEQTAPINYRLSAGSQTRSFTPAGTAHIYEPDEYQPLCGIGPLQAALRVIQLDYDAQGYDAGMLKNGGEPGAVIIPEASLTEGQADELSRRIHDATGSKEGNGANLVLSRKVTWHSNAFSAKDMQFSELRKMNREAIFAAIGVTLPVMGLTEGVNYASASEARKTWWEDMLLPWAADVVEQIQEQIIARCPGRYSEYVIALDTTGVPALREDKGKKITAVLELMSKGGRSWNESVRIADLDADEVEGGDERYVPFGMQRADEAGLSAAEAATGEVNPSAGEATDIRGPVQDEALNGAQVTALVDIAAQVASKTLPSETAKGIIRAAYPTVDEQEVNRIIDPAAAFEPPAPLAPRDAPGQEADKADAVPSKDAARRKAINPEQRALERRAIVKAGEKRARKAIERLRIRVRPILAGMWQEQILKLRKIAAQVDSKAAPAPVAKSEPPSESELQQILALNLERWKEQIEKALKVSLNQVVTESSKAAAQLAGGAGEAGLVSASEPRMLQVLQQRLIQVKEGTLSDVAKAIKDTISKGLQQAETGGTIAERVRDNLEALEAQLQTGRDAMGSRAQTIARTEIGIVSGETDYQQWERMGVAKLEWASDLDSEVRESHRIDGETVTLGELFSNGLRFPKDPNGEPANIINCRCQSLPVIDEES